MKNIFCNKKHDSKIKVMFTVYHIIIALFFKKYQKSDNRIKTHYLVFNKKSKEVAIIWFRFIYNTSFQNSCQQYLNINKKIFFAIKNMTIKLWSC